jgi:lipopolysaccharide/colanic/teichoic acid biosynthesis glycosyltransferase
VHSIDELVQLINIVKGEMSLIGPRPELPEALSSFNEFEVKRLNVKPGITGWAAVNGRNELKISERRRLDVFYVDNLSFKLDLIIFFKTLLLIYKKEGVYSN